MTLRSGLSYSLTCNHRLQFPSGEPSLGQATQTANCPDASSPALSRSVSPSHASRTVVHLPLVASSHARKNSSSGSSSRSSLATTTRVLASAADGAGCARCCACRRMVLTSGAESEGL